MEFQKSLDIENSEASADSFFSMLIVPQSLREVEIFSRLQISSNTMTIEKRGSWEDSGLALYTKSMLPVTDPRTIAFVKRLWAEHQRSKPQTQ